MVDRAGEDGSGTARESSAPSSAASPAASELGGDGGPDSGSRQVGGPIDRPAHAAGVTELSPGQDLRQPGGDAAFDHPIFSESIRRIRAWLGDTGLDPVQAQVLERLVHSSGDLSLAAELRFSDGACDRGLKALAAGAVILTDTAMAAAAVAPMARRTFGNRVCSVLDWAPPQASRGGTRAADGMDRALEALSGCAGSAGSPLVVLIGSAPTALELLLDRVWRSGARWRAPDLVIGMPVGFVGVAESKRHLADSGLPQIRLEGSRGGAGLVAAATNALLRHAWLEAGRV